MSDPDPQKRVDRIHAFRAELRALEAEGVLALDEEQARRVRRHHDAVLERLAGEFDVDTTEGQKQLSLGMRIVSLLGAIALCAALFFVFYRYWGDLGTATQVLLVAAAPVAATAGLEWSARRERTLYIAGIVGLVAVGAFVLNLSVLGSVFNVVSTPRAFLVWAAFAFLLAYAYGLRILLVAGILSLSGYLSATMGTWGGCYWLSFGERPENFLPAGLVLLAISFLPHRRFRDFPPLYRIFGLLGLFLPILVLGNWGQISYLMLPHEEVEHLYQNGSFVVAAIVIGLGIRGHLREVTNVGCTFFVVFLYTKLYDWWWDWMPKYLFFLALGAIAVILLLVLRKLRAMGAQTRTPGSAA